MTWLYLALAASGLFALVALLSFWLIRRLGRREPYAGFLRLNIRQKLTFFRLLLLDNQVPIYIKLLPVAVAFYIVWPIDLLPGIPLDDLAVALLALVLIIRFTPPSALNNLLLRAAAAPTKRPK